MVAKTLPSHGNTKGRNRQDVIDHVSGQSKILTLVPRKGQHNSIDNHYTDLGNAAYMRERHGDRIRYVPKWDCWLVWDGRRWAKDETYQIEQYAKDTIISMYAHAVDVSDEKRGEFIKHVHRSESHRAVQAMVGFFKSEPGIAINPDVLDTDDLLLNLANGTLDLRTGELLPHRREDMITKITDVPWIPGATAPDWLEFMNTIMCGDVGLVQFLQEAVGISLSGDTSDEIFIVLHGPQGANGKSTFLETVLMLVGEYGKKTPTSTFLKKRGEGVSNDVAALVGARFVFASETDEGQQLSEALVKELTGGEAKTARFLFKEHFTFQPKLTPFLATNHRPPVKGTDNGIWRRMRLVPFQHRFNANGAQPIDKRIIMARFREQLPGILAWAVQGWMQRQERGRIIEPASMSKATQDYRKAMDTLGGFIEDTCVLHPNARISASEFYNAYKAWADQMGEHEISGRRFGEQMAEREEFERKKTKTGWFYYGVGLRAEYPQEEDDGPSGAFPVALPPVEQSIAPQAADRPHMAPVEPQKVLFRSGIICPICKHDHDTPPTVVSHATEHSPNGAAFQCEHCEGLFHRHEDTGTYYAIKPGKRVF